MQNIKKTLRPICHIVDQSANVSGSFIDACTMAIILSLSHFQKYGAVKPNLKQINAFIEKCFDVNKDICEEYTAYGLEHAKELNYILETPEGYEFSSFYSDDVMRTIHDILGIQDIQEPDLERVLPISENKPFFGIAEDGTVLPIDYYFLEPSSMLSIISQEFIPLPIAAGRATIYVTPEAGDYIDFGNDVGPSNVYCTCGDDDEEGELGDFINNKDTTHTNNGIIQADETTQKFKERHVLFNGRSDIFYQLQNEDDDVATDYAQEVHHDDGDEEKEDEVKQGNRPSEGEDNRKRKRSADSHNNDHYHEQNDRRQQSPRHGSSRRSSSNCHNRHQRHNHHHHNHSSRHRGQH